MTGDYDVADPGLLPLAGTQGTPLNRTQCFTESECWRVLDAQGRAEHVSARSKSGAKLFAARSLGMVPALQAWVVRLADVEGVVHQASFDHD